MKKFLKLFVIIFCLTTFVPSPIPNIGLETVEATTKIKLNYTKKTLYEGENFKLKITGTKKKVKWTSSNKKVATVSSKGIVTAKDGGDSKRTCKITASVGGKKYVCKITVKTTDNNVPDNTVSPTNNVSENIAALKAYIKKYGYENSEGNKVISEVNNSFASAVIYEEKQDSLYFLFISKGTLELYMNMTISSSDNSSPIDASFMCFGNGSAFIADGTVIPSEYSDATNCYFSFTSNLSPLNESDIQESANILLHMAFSEWNFLLSYNANLTMADIGFSSYK